MDPHFGYWNATGVLAVLVCLWGWAPSVFSWQQEWRPNYLSTEPEYLTTADVFQDANQPDDDSFKLLRVEGDRLFVGTRNRMHYLQFGSFKHISTIEWTPDSMTVSTCTGRGKKECDNYIRVVILKNESLYYICGTHAYQPRCRHYSLQEDGLFQPTRSDFELGTGISPFNPHHNSTAIYVDGKIFAATVSDADERDPLILQKVNDSVLVRTITRDSLFLNEPHFVSSFDKNDKVFFFFRETAVENINCGKAVFSRVARVCQKDRGSDTHQNTFTSFFKARLNCSIPGEYPFYFDEIQATSEFGLGNYRASSNSGDRSDMIYGVFNTPENAIQGSAVCAFSYSDIENTFRGRFKGQESYLHNWLPIGWDETPKPHPIMCTSDSTQLSYSTFNFIKKHPLMDDAVPAMGRRPLLVVTSFKSKFTQIAIDWQVLAADGKYYDVMFIGTDDGRVIKAINPGFQKVDTVVIEDIQVLEPGRPVVDLKVVKAGDSQSLAVVSKQQVVSIPLHRCSRANSCSACVKLQDPYCVWSEDKKCVHGQTGFQNLSSGVHVGCGLQEVKDKEATTPTPTTDTPSTKCPCPTKNVIGSFIVDKHDDRLVVKSTPGPVSADAATTRTEFEALGDEQVAATTALSSAPLITAETLIVALTVSIVVSLLLGFFLGYKFQACRQQRRGPGEGIFYDLQRGRNRLSSGDNPYFHTDFNLPPKQINYVVNPTKQSVGLESKPVTKSSKVYL